MSTTPDAFVHAASGPYPVAFDVDYPDRPLNRRSTFLLPFYALPVVIVLCLLTGSTGAAPRRPTRSRPCTSRSPIRTSRPSSRRGWPS